MVIVSVKPKMPENYDAFCAAAESNKQDPPNFLDFPFFLRYKHIKSIFRLHMTRVCVCVNKLLLTSTRVPYHIKTKIFNTYILPVVLYGMEAKKLQQTMETFQNHIMRFMTNPQQKQGGYTGFSICSITGGVRTITGLSIT